MTHKLTVHNYYLRSTAACRGSPHKRIRHTIERDLQGRLTIKAKLGIFFSAKGTNGEEMRDKKKKGVGDRRKIEVLNCACSA